MRKSLLFLLSLLMLMQLPSAWAEGLSFTVAPDSIRPGKMERISFSVSQDGAAGLSLLDADSGEERFVIRQNVAVSAGVNHLTWDGSDLSGAVVAPGQYLLSLQVNGESAVKPLSVGEPSPQILSLSASPLLEGADVWPFSVEVNEPGTLSVRLRGENDEEWTGIFSQAVSAGPFSASWDGAANGQRVAPGAYSVQFILTDLTGFSGTARQMTLTVTGESESSPAPGAEEASGQPGGGSVMIPSAVTPKEDENNYWTLPIGVFDEAAIWDIMMQPITVIDGKDQRDVYALRKTPDPSSAKDNIVGEITFLSQGVHVLETLDNGWTLIEAYNSSYGPDCASRRGYGVTDDLIQGYVRTSLLKTITPRTEYGLLIDKCEQRMYIFSNGHCIGTLLVSTGLNNAKQSWNETPSGEFLMVSRMGGFAAGNLWCAYGMRINGGCAIHEVPYIGNESTPAANRDYSSTVKMLGQKASHGCIRVQKAANEQGQNIKWLWDNIKVNTKVLIWDDTGRIRPYPAADDYELYYNPNGGQYYHENQNCPSVKSRFLPLTAFTYGELDSGSFAKLTPCPKCASIMRKSQIDAMNAEAAK